jgi:hypothetical protein
MIRGNTTYFFIRDAACKQREFCEILRFNSIFHFCREYYYLSSSSL